MKNVIKVVFTIVVLTFIACSSSDDDATCTESTWYQDMDADGLGNIDVSINACEQPDGYVSNSSDTDDSGCVSDQMLDNSRGACDQTLAFSNIYSESISGSNRIISSNCIPEHMVGRFGMGQGSLNPNAISEQNEMYTIALNPTEASSFTALLSTSGGDQIQVHNIHLEFC